MRPSGSYFPRRALLENRLLTLQQPDMFGTGVHVAPRHERDRSVWRRQPDLSIRIIMVMWKPVWSVVIATTSSIPSECGGCALDHLRQQATSTYAGIQLKKRLVLPAWQCLKCATAAMIYLLVTRRNQHPMRIYLQSWGAELAHKVKTVLYEELPLSRVLPPGTYIFADLELLTPTEFSMVALVWEQLSRTPEKARVLNDPGHYLGRYKMLTTLYERGQNRFRVVRASGFNAALRFPVFLREARRHTGSLTDLLHNHQELRRARFEARIRGFPLSDLLVVEFCDTSDASGLFRKYSAFMLGNQIIPRHLIFSRHWVLKTPDLIDEDKVREEQEYLKQNPHEDWIREVFNLAGISYGRIDYGLLNGEPQAWEINTNPMVMLEPEQYEPMHVPTQQQFARRIQSAFEALDTGADGDGVTVEIPRALRWRLKVDKSRSLVGRAYGKLRRRVIGLLLREPLIR